MTMPPDDAGQRRGADDSAATEAEAMAPAAPDAPADAVEAVTVADAAPGAVESDAKPRPGGVAGTGDADAGPAGAQAADAGDSADAEGGASPVALVPAGDVLRRAGALDAAAVEAVEARQAETGQDFDSAAVSLALATPADVEAARARLLARIAPGLQPSGRISDEIVVLSDPASPRAEAIRLLRTQIISQHVGTGRRAFAVSAAVAGSGTTYIAANLAVALSQVGIKTLLVDANLRDPRIDSIFGLEPGGPGLTSFLGFQASRPERILYPDVLPNLSIIPSGPPVARPQELLSGARFRAGVDILLREFDVAIFDTAPANESADALTVAGVIGYALVVARRHSAYVRDVQVLTDQLGAARATVIGSVLSVIE